MKKILFSLLITFLSFNLAIAQMKTTHRIEIPLKDGYTEEQTFYFGKNGLVQTSRTEKASNGERKFRFTVYDASLREKSTQEFNYPKKMNVFQVVQNQENIHVLLINGITRPEFILLTFNLPTEKIADVSGTFIEKFKIGYSNMLMSSLNKHNMLANGSNVYIAGAVKKVPTVCIIDAKSGDVSDFDMTVENVKPKKVKIMSGEVLPESNEIVYYIAHDYHTRVAQVIAKVYTAEGKLKNSIVINENGEKKISMIRGVNLGENQYAFTGAYGANYFPESTVGICYFRAENDNIKVSKYYNYLDFENYLKYLPEYVQNRINKKKDRKESRGKELEFTTGSIFHPLQICDDGIILLTECYYPTYRTQTTYSNGKAISTTVFDGYQYTHGVLVKILDDGNVAWDNIFALAPQTKPIYPRTFITVNQDISKDITMVYSTGINIYRKSFNLGGTVRSTDEKIIDVTEKDGDKVKYSFSNVEFWYDNYFLMSGYQKIKNAERDENGKKVREVLFMNKLEF